MIVLLAWIRSAFAEEALESETVLQVRHDFFGEPLVPFYEYVRLFQRAGPVDVSAYAGGEWSEGIGAALDPELYLLEVDGRTSWGQWSLGRQQALTALRPQTFDGGRVEWRPSDGLTLGAWGGIARHHDLDDLEEGKGLGRIEARLARGPGALRAGLELDEALDLQEDIEGRVALGDSTVSPELRALGVWTGDELRWGRAALSGSLLPGARVTLQGERRITFDPTDLLGEALVAAFAPEAVDGLSLGLRLSDRTWSALSVRYGVDAYDQVDERVFGHAIDASWMKATSAPFQVVPAYRFRAGPGGVFHAAVVSASFALGDDTRLTAQAASVPYRKLHDAWAHAAAGGLSIHQALGDLVGLSAGADAAQDATYAFDLRSTCVLRVSL